MLGFLC